MTDVVISLRNCERCSLDQRTIHVFGILAVNRLRLRWRMTFLVFVQH